MSARGVPPFLRMFLAIDACLVVVCLLVEAFCGRVLHLGYPYNWPLMFPNVSFMDFRWYFQHFNTLHTTAFFQGPDIMMYPAPVVMCYWFFYSFQPIATEVFLGVILASSLVAAVMVWRAFVHRGMAVRYASALVGMTYLLAYPFWFEFKQANMEIVVWIFLSLALLSFFKRFYWIAALLIGVAGAMKFYPLIYLGLLIARKRYRECVFSCVIAALVVVTSLWLLGPTVSIAWHGTQTGLEIFRSQYMLIARPNEIGFDHSLFAVIKSGLAFTKIAGLTPAISEHARSVLLSSYLALAAVIGTALYFLKIRYLPVTNQLLCLTVASISLPPVSFDYTLIHLYAPWTLLVFVAWKARRNGIFIPGLSAIFACLAFALAPLGELIFRHERFGGEVRALVLLAIFVIALRFPFEFQVQGSSIPSGEGTDDPAGFGSRDLLPG